MSHTSIVKGYEYAPGQFLVLDEIELERLRPALDRALTWDNFLDMEQINPLLYAGRSLYLAPAGLAAAAAYIVLTQAMRTRRQAALGRLVLSGRRHLTLLRPRRALLLLHRLHYPAQLQSGARLKAELSTQPAGSTELRKEDGKTRSVYVPKELLPEVRSWLAEHKRLKSLLKEIHQLTLALLKARARHLKLKAGRR